MLGETYVGNYWKRRVFMNSSVTTDIIAGIGADRVWVHSRTISWSMSLYSEARYKRTRWADKKSRILSRLCSSTLTTSLAFIARQLGRAWLLPVLLFLPARRSLYVSVISELPTLNRRHSLTDRINYLIFFSLDPKVRARSVARPPTSLYSIPLFPP